MRSRSAPRLYRWILTLLLLLSTTHVAAYSVLTHEQLIDLAWTPSIRPLLLARFPRLTEAQLLEAHAYAYGGCAIQDLGYYPFGKKFFSDLTHYVRTGDFVAALLRDAKTADELAFAIGALSHYVGDTVGHSQAVNVATALEFPKLEQKFGPLVTYDENPHAHVRTEFAFDIGQLAKHHFAPTAYLNYVGIAVPRKLLEKAFRETYGIDAHEILGRAHPALRSYEGSVRHFIPDVAGAEVVVHGHQFSPDGNDEADHLFAQRLSQVAFERQGHWRRTYGKPGFKAHLLAIVIRIVPKIGPFSMLAIKVPSAQTEDLYVHSVNHSIDRLRAMIDQLRQGSQIELTNLDLDTGSATRPGTYKLADRTYAELLVRLVRRPQNEVPPGTRADILDFYRGSANNLVLQQNTPHWQQVQRSLQDLIDRKEDGAAPR